MCECFLILPADSMQLIGTCDTPTALNYNIYTLISAGKFIGLGSNYPSFLNFPQPDGNVNSLRIKSLLDGEFNFCE